MVGLQARPRDVVRRFGSSDAGLFLEARGNTPLTSSALSFPHFFPQEFVLFLSTAAQSEALVCLVPLSLLRDAARLYPLISTSRGGSPDRGQLDAVVSLLGLDWSATEVDAYVAALATKPRRADDAPAAAALPFLSAIVRSVERGFTAGTKTLVVRAWFPGRWYLRQWRAREPDGGAPHAASLHLFIHAPLPCDNGDGGDDGRGGRSEWLDAGEARARFTPKSRPSFFCLRDLPSLSLRPH